MKLIDNFSDERGWENNDPNILITSTLIELGELAEHYQWSNTFKKYTDIQKKEIGFEFVDVLFYLLRIASKSKIDLDKIFLEKVEKLRIKFPVNSDYLEQHNLYRKTGKNRLYE